MAAMNHVNKSTRRLAIGEGPYMVLKLEQRLIRFLRCWRLG